MCAETREGGAFSVPKFFSSMCVFAVILSAHLLAGCATSQDTQAEPQESYPPLGKEIQSFHTREPIAALAWSPDQQYLAGTDWNDKSVYLWSLASGKKIWQIENANSGRGRSIAFSPDGRSIVTSFTENVRKRTDGAVSLLSVKTGRVIRHVFAESSERSVARASNFDMDGGLAAVILGHSGRVAIYDAVFEAAGWTPARVLGPVVNRFGNTRGLKHIVLDAENDRVILGITGNEIQVWSLSENRKLSGFDAYSFSNVRTMVRHGPSGTLVTGGDMVMRGNRKVPPATGESMASIISGMSHDDFSTLLRSWNPLTGEQKRVYAGPVAAVRTLRISPDSRLLAVARNDRRNGYIVVHEVESGAIIGAVSGRAKPYSGLVFSPDGKKLAYSDDSSVHIIALPNATTR